MRVAPTFSQHNRQRDSVAVRTRSERAFRAVWSKVTFAMYWFTNKAIYWLEAQNSISTPAYCCCCFWWDQFAPGDQEVKHFCAKDFQSGNYNRRNGLGVWIAYKFIDNLQQKVVFSSYYNIFVRLYVTGFVVSRKLELYLPAICTNQNFICFVQRSKLCFCFYFH